MKINWMEWEVIAKFCEQEKLISPNKSDINVVERSSNPVGFMTDLKENLATQNLKYSKNIYELIPTAISQPSGSSLGFLLFFSNGVLSTIEGYVDGEQWPDDDVSLQFTSLPVSI